MFFSRASLDYTVRSGKQADVLQIHNWETAIVGPLFWEIFVNQGLRGTGILLTCHDYHSQHLDEPEKLAQCGLDSGRLHRPDRLQDNTKTHLVNILKELNQTVAEYDDYDGYDDYELEDEAEEEEHEEKEERKPTKEELEYLELRQRLKERIRRKMKKETGSAHTNSNDKRKRIPSDNYGSFFGPSQPIIAQRVIQESKSLLETREYASTVSNALNSSRKSYASNNVDSKRESQYRAPKKVMNQLKTKAQQLKNTRDYSFLLSDDAELPVITKEAPPRIVSVPHTEVRSTKSLLKSKQHLGNTGRHGNACHEERKQCSVNDQMPSNRNVTSSKPNMMPVTSKQHPGNNWNGHRWPSGQKGPSLKTPVATLQKKTSASVMRESTSGLHKSLPSKLLSPSPSLKHHVDKKKESLQPATAKLLPKQSVPSLKSQINKPQKQTPLHCPSQDYRPKKKPLSRYSDDEDDDDGGKAINMIRKMFGYNPSKFSGCDDDDSDMEANFSDILMEEQRSSKIARKEDAEQLRLIEEEEERERQARMRRLKKRKMG